MRSIFFLTISFLLIAGCNKKEEVKFEAFSPEAFAYDIGDSWEINATVNVKGFVKKEVGDEFTASLEFTIDMIGPNSLEVTNIFSDSKDATSNELIDIQLEAQFELDQNSPYGIYIINFNVTDRNSGEVTSAQTEFELKK
jgi:hypothetical protein